MGGDHTRVVHLYKVICGNEVVLFSAEENAEMARCESKQVLSEELCAEGEQIGVFNIHGCIMTSNKMLHFAMYA